MLPLIVHIMVFSFWDKALLQGRQAKQVKIAKPLANLNWQKAKTVYYAVVKRWEKKSRSPTSPTFSGVPKNAVFGDLDLINFKTN